MKTYKRLLAALMLGSFLSASVLGCNTFRGAGKDIQRGGEKIENAAEGAQNK
jgi:predicted small secreted protein